MLYDCSNALEKKKAKARCDYLIEKGKVLEIKEKRPKRSYSQNNYLHLILSYFGLQTGYTLQEVKQEIFKKIVNPSIFYEGEFGEVVKVERWRSSADLNTLEMTTAIDRFRDYSTAQAGIYLPTPDDLVSLREIEREIENNQYL